MDAITVTRHHLLLASRITAGPLIGEDLFTGALPSFGVPVFIGVDRSFGVRVVAAGDRVGELAGPVRVTGVQVGEVLVIGVRVGALAGQVLATGDRVGVSVLAGEVLAIGGRAAAGEPHTPRAERALPRRQGRRVFELVDIISR